MAELVITKADAIGKTRWSILLGAVFLMATSAIGPGFLTQTAVFTEKFGANNFLVKAHVVGNKVFCLIDIFLKF